MHSSYGLAFVVLFLGAGVLVVDDVRRRRLPGRGARRARRRAAALLLTALALAYDPQRMRYVAFSVALASTVFGTALRVRLWPGRRSSLAAVTLAVSVAYFVPRPAGLALLSGNRTPERSARWFVQAESGNGDLEAFRFLADRIPPKATIALDVAPNTYLYPAWDAGLRRTVLFVPDGGPVPTMPSGSWSGRLGRRTRIASRRRGGRSHSRPRAAGASSVVREAAAHDAFRGWARSNRARPDQARRAEDDEGRRDRDGKLDDRVDRERLKDDDEHRGPRERERETQLLRPPDDQTDEPRDEPEDRRGKSFDDRLNWRVSHSFPP